MTHSATASDDAIKKALKDVTTAADQYAKLSERSGGDNGVVRDGVNSAGELTVSHNELSVKALQLICAIRGPVDMLFAHFENVSLHSPGLILNPLPSCAYEVCLPEGGGCQGGLS